MPVTRAKFKCHTITLRASQAIKDGLKYEGATGKDGPGYYDKDGNKDDRPYVDANLPTIEMSPVMAVPGDETHENSRFWKASPGGELRLNIDNPAGAEVFELGREYYVDFTPAD